MRVPMVATGRFVPVPASEAFELLVQTRTWPAWGPSVTAVDPPDARIGPGAVGRVRTAVGLWVPYRVTTFDEGRAWAWQVAGVPATGHRVEPADGGCRVAFDVPVVAAPYLVVCRVALCRIAALLTERA